MSQISPPTAPEPVSPKIGTSAGSKIFAMREAGTLAALVLMLLVIAVAIPQFRQWENLVNITRNFSFVGIVAMGMTLVILTGGIDLSVGSVWGMTAVLTAFLMSNGWQMAPAILTGLLAAAVVGSLQRLWITPLTMSRFAPTP